MRRRIPRISPSERVDRSRPSKITRPPVGGSRRRMQRPVVVLPQPDSPTRPSVSPRPISKLTPSTALTTAGRPPKSPPPTSKCFTRFSTRRIGSGVLMRSGGSRGGRVKLAGEPAGREVIGRDRLEPGLVLAAPIDGEGAPGREGAAHRQAREVGGLAGDGLELRPSRLVQ